MKSALKNIGFSLLGIALVVGGALGGAWFNFVTIRTPVEDVTFQSQGFTMSGKLIKPEGQGPFPVVVILHGSGPMVIDHPVPHIQGNAFVKGGIAAFFYDKRGCGTSEGIFHNADFRVLMADVNAAIDYLQSREDIDASRVGLATNSESGFYAPEIAKTRRDIKFIYNRVAPTVTYMEDSAYQLRLRFLAAGISSDDADNLVALLEDLYSFFIKSDGNPEYYNSDAKSLLKERLSEAFNKFNPRYLPFYRSIRIAYNPQLISRRAHTWSYDPMKFIEGNPTPMYYAFGSEDVLVPTARCIEMIKALRSETGQDITFYVYDGDDHTLNSPLYLFSGAYPPGYLDRMVSWAKEKLHN